MKKWPTEKAIPVPSIVILKGSELTFLKERRKFVCHHWSLLADPRIEANRLKMSQGLSLSNELSSHQAGKGMEPNVFGNI